MQEQFTFFVGADVSKLTLDMSITCRGIEVHSSPIANTKKAVAA